MAGMKAKLVEVNHVVLEVGNVDEALEWYWRIFDFTLRDRAGRMVFLDTGESSCASSPNQPGL